MSNQGDLPISHIEDTRPFHGHTARLAEAGVARPRPEGPTQGQAWLSVSKRLELKHLMHGNIGDPEASLMVNGQAMGHVEEGAAPGLVRTPGGTGELEQCGDLDGAFVFVLVVEVKVERAAYTDKEESK